MITQMSGIRNLYGLSETTHRYLDGFFFYRILQVCKRLQHRYEYEDVRGSNPLRAIRNHSQIVGWFFLLLNSTGL